MARVYDDLRRLASKSSETATANRLKKAIVVSGDNVWHYLADTHQYDLDSTAMLPCVIPPFKNTFVEWRPLKKEKAGIGWLFHFAELNIGAITIKTPDMPDEVKWAVVAEMFVTTAPNQPHMTAEIWLDEHGMFVYQEHSLYTLSARPGSPIQKLMEEQFAIDGKIIGFETATVSLNIALWTLAFFHTDKVLIEDNAPPEKLSKAHQKRHNIPLCTYKTLKVTSIGKAAKDAQGGEHSTPRLHIVRGHWMDCRFGAGLFGNPKAKGIYWKGEHSRGEGEKGAVKKDYEVIADGNET